MGIFDNVTSSINRGTAAAGRAAQTAKLRSQMKELQRRRQQLTSQLGASLYPVTRNEPLFREGREVLYDEIADCDTSLASVQAELDALEAQAAAVARTACPSCGAPLTAADAFCGVCGADLRNFQTGNQDMDAYCGQSSDGATCPECGAPAIKGDVFCMRCGASIEGTEEAIREIVPNSAASSVPQMQQTSIGGVDEQAMKINTSNTYAQHSAVVMFEREGNDE